MNRSFPPFLSLLIAVGLALISSGETRAQVQDYEPLLAEGRTWNVYEGGWVATPSCIYFGLDTVIEGLVYKAILQQYSEDYETVMGWIREDAAEQKVYLRDPWNLEEPEKMYYDFDVVVGDTVWSALCDMPMVVNTVDVVEWANGTSSERIGLQLLPGNTNFLEYWVEGIGSMNGVLAPGAMQCTADWDPILCCVTNGLELQFERTEDWIPEHEACDIAVIDDVSPLGGRAAVISYRLDGRILTASGDTPIRVYSRTGILIKHLMAGQSTQLPTAGSYLIQSPTGAVHVVVL